VRAAENHNCISLTLPEAGNRKSGGEKKDRVLDWANGDKELKEIQGGKRKGMSWSRTSERCPQKVGEGRYSADGEAVG